MSTRKWLLGVVGVVATAALLVQGCSDSDNPTGPGGGNPGTGSAGTYTLSLSQWTCGMMDTMSASMDAVFCSDFTLQELLELDCPITIVNNAFTIDCTSNVTDGACTYTERVQATGTVNGDTWTVEGTVTITNENPPGCEEPPCAGVRASIEKTAEAPSACAYADLNTVAATIVGGPFAGSTVLDAGGFGSDVGGLFTWSIFANASSGFAAKRPDDIANLANLSISLVGIDPLALPAVIDITVTGGGIAGSALAEGMVSYSDQTTAGTFFYSTGGSGSITVEEVSDTHIAGTINSLSIEGQESTDTGPPTQATRSLSGGFFVQDLPVPAKATHSVGWVDRLLN